MCLLQQSLVGNQINSIFPGQEKSHGEPPLFSRERVGISIPGSVQNQEEVGTRISGGADWWFDSTILKVFSNINSTMKNYSRNDSALQGTELDLKAWKGLRRIYSEG